MEPLVPTITFENLRRAKKNAQTSLKELGIDLSSSTTGNLVANIFGYKDWNAASAIAKKNEVSKTEGEPVPSAVKHITTMRSVLEKEISIKYALERAVVYEGFGKTLVNNLLSKASFSDLYVWDAKNISFIPSVSTAVIGAAGCGKSYMMMIWADALENDPDGMRYVYFVSEEHRYGTELRGVKETNTEDMLKGTGDSGIIFIGRDESYEKYAELIRMTMENEYHIFIDENPFFSEMLNGVLEQEYSSFTVAVQAASDFQWHIGRGVKSIGFERLIIGRCHDLQSINIIGMLIDGIGREISTLERGQFLKASLVGSV